MRRQNRCRAVARGFSLVEILVVIALLAIVGGGLAFFYLGKSKPGEKNTTPIGKARGVECVANLRSIRQSLQAGQAMEEEGKFPATLQEMKLPGEILSCPDSKNPYEYDSNSGQVRCTQPGHENY